MAIADRRLIERFVEDGLARDTAREVTQLIANADDDIRAAAEFWLEMGAMPETPVVQDYSPQELATFLRPSEVLTALIQLRTDPSAALEMLQHPDHLWLVQPPAELAHGAGEAAAHGALGAHGGVEHPAVASASWGALSFDDLVARWQDDPAGEPLVKVVGALNEVAGARRASIQVGDPPPELARHVPAFHAKVGEDRTVIGTVLPRANDIETSVNQLRSYLHRADTRPDRVSVVLVVPEADELAAQRALGAADEVSDGRFYVCPYGKDYELRDGVKLKGFFEGQLPAGKRWGFSLPRWPSHGVATR